MALKEQDIVLTTKDAAGNTVIQMPITRAGNVEDLTSTCLPLTGGGVTGNLTVQNKNVVRSVEGATADTSGEVKLPTTGVSAGSYGPSANATPSAGATFNVPYITVDAKGRLTAASTKTVKMPTVSIPAASSSTMGGIKPASAWVKILESTSNIGTYSYTATKNCFVCAYNMGGTNNMTVSAAIGGLTIYRDYGHHNDGNNSYPMFYLSKGQTITITQNSAKLHFSVLDLE